MSNQTFSYLPKGQVGSWVTSMIVIAVFNIVLYGYVLYDTRKNLTPGKHKAHAWSYVYSFWMRLLPLPFLLNTVWRSFLPCLYNSRRTILADGWNNIPTARGFAFVGEICWATQVGWALKTIALHIPLRGSETTKKSIRTLIPLVGYYIIFVAIFANVCSVTGMITTNYVLVVIEETLWASIFLSGAIASMFLWHFGVDSWSFDYGSNCFGHDLNPFDDPNKEQPHDPPSVWVMRMFIRGYTLFGVGAFIYMVTTDIPKWHARYVKDQSNGVVYFGFSDGISDAVNRRMPTQAYEDWDQDMLWMSGYFSMAVWASFALAYAPGRINACKCASDWSVVGSV